MKNKFIIIYSIFASIIFLFAIAFFTVNLSKEYNYGNTRTSDKYQTIEKEINAKAKDVAFSEQNLISILNKNVGQLTDYAYIKVSVNKSDIYKYPAKVANEDLSSKLTRNYNSVIQSTIGVISINADMYLLRPSSIFYFAKISFLIILIVTIVTIILIIYLNISTEKITANKEENENITEEKIQEPTLDAASVSEENKNSEIQENTPEISAEIEENKINQEETSIQNKTSDKDFTAEAESSDSHEEKPVTKIDLPIEEKPSQIELKDENTDNPAGLFNPVTGFGWEQYFLTRLESEINRAISSEIDLSLFLIRLPGLSRDSELIKNVCNYIAIQFQFKDLLFEYKDDCLAAIKISMDLDEALNFADKIYSDVKNIIQDKDCYIGISTRSIRMVSAERLIHEADEALLHAKDDKDSPIIAFRVDAEKYRQFLEQNQN